jgi:hypothetical protein
VYGGEEKYIHGFGGKRCRKETTFKTYAEMGGYIRIDLTEIGC